jgi:hypothetical protein
MTSAAKPFLPAALRISAGVIVWALHFASLYGFNALACARGFPGAVPWVTGAATLAALAGTAWLLIREGRREGFEGWLAFSIAAVVLVAILFQTAPLLIVSPCA